LKQTNSHIAKSLIKFSTLSLTAVVAVSATAGGFEKSTTWSGKNTGVGNAVVSSVNDSESLYFNPAGLAFMEDGYDASLNFSPTFGQFKGPLNNGGSGALRENTSNRAMSPVFGATFGYKPSARVGFGAGVFVSGGNKAVYEELDFSQVNANFVYKPRASTELSLTEISAGAAFKVTSNFSLGAGWRFALVKAALWEPTIGGSAITETSFKDLSDTNGASFRVGAQYKTDSFGVGVNVRTPIKFKAEGTLGVRTINHGTTTPVNQSGSGDGTAASIEATFPLQVELGTHFMIGSSGRLMLVYGYSKYSVNESLIQNTIGGTSRTLLNWNDQHHVRLGYEQQQFFGKMPLRVGYVVNSAVVPSRVAKITFSSPAPGHTINVGSGYEFGSGLNLDFSLEYAFANGNDAYSLSGVFGDYKSNAYAFHTGVNYKF